MLEAARTATWSGVDLCLLWDSEEMAMVAGHDQPYSRQKDRSALRKLKMISDRFSGGNRRPLGSWRDCQKIARFPGGLAAPRTPPQWRALAHALCVETLDLASVSTTSRSVLRQRASDAPLQSQLMCVGNRP